MVMHKKTTGSVIDEAQINSNLNSCIKEDPVKILEILEKARELKGLSLNEVATLSTISSLQLLEDLFKTAAWVKEEIYGKRLVLFAPLYISNLCGNECSYCAFRAKNKAIVRRALSQEEIARETKALIDTGHKRVLLVAGESYPHEGFDYVLKSIDTVYKTTSRHSNIRRINVNIAPLSTQEFARLNEYKIGTYQLFQETYERGSYKKVHLAGKKADYDWRISAIDRAMEAGIEDVGIGVLFGLSNWRYEIMAILSHANYLENKFGVGPHTISIPRLEPASGSDISMSPPYPIGDTDFKKIVAILRLAVPYTGIIMSTRETPNLRRESFALGVSQISAGSRTNPGGYSKNEEDMSQFSLGDHRSLDEVLYDVASMGYVPSFCTGCYRLGRVGADFMDLARPGDIKTHCNPNALSSFLEYLIDYASPETKEIGLKCIEEQVEALNDEAARHVNKLLDQVKSGKRDVFC